MAADSGNWAAVLAGGPGARMGGHKPQRCVGGKRLIDLALAAVRELYQQVVVVTNEIGQFADLDCRLLTDRWPGQGPLAAIATAFLDTPAKTLLVVPVDLPLLQRPVLELVAAAQPGQLARAPIGPRGLEPLVCWLDRGCLPTVMRLLTSGERRTRRLLEEVEAHYIAEEAVKQVDPEWFSFMNVNYPDDLDEVSRIAYSRGLIATP